MSMVRWSVAGALAVGLAGSGRDAIASSDRGAWQDAGAPVPVETRQDRFKDPRTRPWAIVIMLCFAGLVVLLLIPTRSAD